MAHATHSVTLELPDGSTHTHTAEALGYRHMGDGGVAVLAACCGRVGGELCTDCNGIGCKCCGHRGITKESVVICPSCRGERFIDGVTCVNCVGRGEIKEEDTRSWHTFYDIGMPTSDGTQIGLPVSPDLEVIWHVRTVAKRHAARHKPKANLDSLMKPRGVSPVAAAASDLGLK